MNRFAVSIAVLSTTLFSGAAQAMEIRQFDKMAVPDQAEYFGLLIAGAEQVLNADGRADLAAKVVQLFTTTMPGDAHTMGNVEFQMNLALAREADVKRSGNDPNAHRLEVEDAMLVTLKKNNIPMSQEFIRDFRTINRNFRPKYPSQKQ